MNRLAHIIGLALLLHTSAWAADYASEFKEAGRLYAEGSHQRAHEAYRRAAALARSEEDKRWAEFRAAATLARSEASTQQADDSALRAAEAELQKYIAPETAADQIWAEAQEALGDLQWRARNRVNWGGGWPHYERALSFWASSTNLSLAAERYWRIVRNASEPAQRNRYSYYGYHGNIVPLSVLENALKIARNENEKAQAHYMIAMTLRYQGGDWEQRFRVPSEFEAALAAKKDTPWYDDALYFYAEWMNSSGRAAADENGNWNLQPDYAKALELFRRLAAEFREGESQWLNEAKNRINEITRPSLGIHASQVFLPGSEIEFNANWRNVSEIEFNLQAVDLTKDVAFRNADRHSQNWLEGIEPRAVAAGAARSWKKSLAKQPPHHPGSESIRLEAPLTPGAYLLTASGGGAQGRELILVTDLSIVLQNADKQALVYACDSATGAPVKQSQILLAERFHDGKAWRWREQTRAADDQGIALFEMNSQTSSREYFISARAGERQAFTLGYGSDPSAGRDAWKIYAFADRPAARPGETIHWKITARTQRGEVYSVPANQKLIMKIVDPRGAEARKETLKLNSFGSAWGKIDLTAEQPLGQYRVVFWDERERNQIGDAALFRLEEYKLPEFKVAIRTAEEGGHKKAFLLGEKVEVEIQAEYYFGGAVSGATVEAVVHQSPLYHFWQQPREFNWYYGDAAMPRRGFDPGQILQRETLKTDGDGKARLVIQTPINQGSDLQYRIEARVTDASRREILASDTVRVSSQRFYVHPKAPRKIYQPQDKVEVEFKAIDVNDQPVVAEGQARVTRDFWFEIWQAPDGREVKGEELKKLQAGAVFPPPPQSGQKPWRLKFRGYQSNEIANRTLKTGTNGLVSLAFTAEREGYYRITWRTDDLPAEGRLPSRPVRAETAVWVATSQSAELGYRSGGLEILADKDTFRAGESAPVMLSVPEGDRYVLFTVSGADLLEYRLVHITGSVKLLNLDIAEKHVPNIFLNGAMVSDQQLFADQEEIIVPPLKNFLNVEVQPDRAQHQPGEKGTLRVTARDHAGQPVVAEVALSFIDESIFYIEQDLAGDPRQFFFGSKRPAMLQTSSSFNQRSYGKLAKDEEEDLVLEERFDRLRDFSSMDGKSKSLRRGVRLGGLAAAAPPASAIRGEALREMAADAVNGQALAFEARKMALSDAPQNGTDGANNASGENNAVQVRTDFRSAIFWQPDLATDRNGLAEVSITYPDSLTGWKATARAATAVNQFGIASASTRTQQPLIVRLQAPRFFLAGDTVTVSAVINNNTDEEIEVAPTLEGAGLEIPQVKRSPVRVAPHSEARVDWSVLPKTPGEARLKATARSARHSDAMEKSYLIHEHGIEKFLSNSGKAKTEDVVATLEIPAARKPGSTRFTIQVTPSLAVTMLDALPYLIDYPYGCTEQTMSRFLPAAITAKTLKELGLQPEDVMNRAFGGIEAAHAAKTQPRGKKNLELLGDMTRQGLQRLYDFQHGDGGWGWWKEGESDPFMTAYVVWGLSLAGGAEINLDLEALNRAAEFLDRQLVETENAHDLQAWMLHALAVRHSAENRRDLSDFQLKAFANLWENRGRLNAYSRAVFALAAHHFGRNDEARTLARNLENGVKRDAAPGQSSLAPGAGLGSQTQPTAHWGDDGIFSRWSEGSVEATAFALRALLAIDPKNELIDPAANWLIKNRRGAQWSNTRDTAIVLLALNDYLRATGEIQGDLEYELVVNGRPLGSRKIAGAEVFAAPEKFTVPAEVIRDGVNEIRVIRKSGQSPIYFAAECVFFSLEEPVAAAGSEVFVRRQYFRLKPVPTLLEGFIYEKQELAPGAVVESGERIETVLTIESKNNLEYLLFEDLKPAGLEAVAVRSGEPLHARRLRAAAIQGKAAPMEAGLAGDSRWVYQELRDRKVALFLDKLPEGFWEIRYESRAETPGEFHALPVLAHAMYVPEIRANSAESKLLVRDVVK